MKHFIRVRFWGKSHGYLDNREIARVRTISLEEKHGNYLAAVRKKSILKVGNLRIFSHISQK